MHLLTAAEMREADRRTIEEIGVPGRVLMESAGRSIVDAMLRHLPELSAATIGIVCGKGNNGGDGLVVLRVLTNMGYRARAWVLAELEDLTGGAIHNLQAALKLGLNVETVSSEEAWDQAVADVRRCDVHVDAILGTGLSQAARGLAARVIEDLSEMPAFTVAVDVPSGLSSDTGSIPGPAVSADLTVALAAPKVCHFVPPACDQCGVVDVAEIGIPPELLRGLAPRIETIEPSALTPLLPGRRAGDHKGRFGHLLVVAGSVGKTGAALMTAEAALRAGAGLVTVATSESAVAMIAGAIPELMWKPLPETGSGAIASQALEPLKKAIAARDALAIGPGLGLEQETVEVVRRLLREASVPTVIDADGLSALGGSRDAVATKPRLALTPHPGEAGRLLGLSAAEVQRDRVSAARRLSAETRGHVLLKGHRSLVADPEGNLQINLTGNPGMATAGSGDVLTGIVGGLLAQGVSTGDALRLAVHLHGRAADLAAEETTQTALVATDITAALPEALRELGAV